MFVHAQEAFAGRDGLLLVSRHAARFLLVSGHAQPAY